MVWPYVRPSISCSSLLLHPTNGIYLFRICIYTNILTRPPSRPILTTKSIADIEKEFPNLCGTSYIAFRTLTLLLLLYIYETQYRSNPCAHTMQSLEFPPGAWAGQCLTLIYLEAWPVVVHDKAVYSAPVSGEKVSNIVDRQIQIYLHISPMQHISTSEALWYSVVDRARAGVTASPQHRVMKAYGN